MGGRERERKRERESETYNIYTIYNTLYIIYIIRERETLAAFASLPLAAPPPAPAAPAAGPVIRASGAVIGRTCSNLGTVSVVTVVN